MPIVQISQIKHRRGLQENLPQLGSAEFGFSIDAQRLFIGSGVREEGAPTEENIEIITEKSPEIQGLRYFNDTITGVGDTILANVNSLINQIATDDNNSLTTALLSYQAKNQSNNHTRTGIFKLSYLQGSNTYCHEDDYTETGELGFSLSLDPVSANLSASEIQVKAISTLADTTEFSFRIDSFRKAPL